jgi:hypothetical protein
MKTRSPKAFEHDVADRQSFEVAAADVGGESSALVVPHGLRALHVALDNGTDQNVTVELVRGGTDDVIASASVSAGATHRFVPAADGSAPPTATAVTYAGELACLSRLFDVEVRTSAGTAPTTGQLVVSYEFA